MIPTRCHEIKGSRPPSLKLAGGSHTIKKTTLCKSQPRPHGQEGPVIIYAHSPKVIHTRAEDFMALVQRLTGLEDIIRRNNSYDVSESSSSVVTEEVNVGGDHYTVAPFSQERTQRQKLADMPLFTPSSMTLFGSPTQLLYMSPNGTDSFSPSVFKFK
ncbi:PREDICTED: VQ motif-containing protein 8, chloroplastic-like [Camelina sativa]|uniref:VQ motif-containing protein 8, chloroplastic-like n=1 Tax=Camelina sativa TaxID=90675 RepID=A0ABM0Z8A8_CAMSA|nr:PREDICTED: VQ motif-containing protein 8, chloroplastic-like [Camelina sativa]